MPGPISRDALHRKRTPEQRADDPGSALEDKLNSLLASSQNDGSGEGDALQTPPEPSPIDKLRALFVERIIPTVRRLNDRYAEKGVRVSIDAADFLSDGRSLFLDIEYGDHRLRLEGTVLEDRIAFHETRYVGDMGGTMAAGPTIRTRHLTDEVFADFIYERVITLVKAATRSS
ncbi:MAG: hypothetical protein V3W34_12615 [Phycisphaerae bacterium]